MVVPLLQFKLSSTFRLSTNCFNRDFNITAGFFGIIYIFNFICNT